MIYKVEKKNIPGITVLLKFSLSSIFAYLHVQNNII